MSNHIRVFSAFADERRHLMIAADILNELSPRGYKYSVGETWFDYGQRWAWTTILCETDKGDSYQALSPAEQEAIIVATTYGEIELICSRILADKFCPDKIEN